MTIRSRAGIRPGSRQTGPPFTGLRRLFKFDPALLLAGCLGLTCGVAWSAPPPAAPGYGALGYRLPRPGSYALPPLGGAPDGEVVDAIDQPRRLHDVFGGKIVLLSFVYSRCSDVNGCPLSSFVFYQLKSAMRRDSLLAQRLQLVSLSFDPGYDTPEVMKLYAANFRYAGQGGDWTFLTTRSEQELAPILAGYNQDVQRQLDHGGHQQDDFSHILRVFLIDGRARIRNIYSVAFLHADLLLNDVRTLLLEEDRAGGAPRAVPVATTAIPEVLAGPGDDKKGYRSRDYRTNSKGLALRQGRSVDLMALALTPVVGLPPPPVPASNPLERDRIQLGRRLFFDRRLSLNDTVSCAMCHIPEQGFTSNELATAVGIEGRSVRRNSPTLYNVAYATQLFHDGREETLEQQIWGPLLARNEMGNPSVGTVLRKIRGIPDYDGRFEAVFGARGLSMETLGMALAAYQRTLVSGNSAFDRWYYNGETEALRPAARRGFQLFTGRAGCSACHIIGPDYALLTDNDLHNTGIGYRESMAVPAATLRVQLAPGVFAEVDQRVIDSVGEPAPADVGRYEITEQPADRWKYKTPSLRNIALTAPYMHNGSIGTLEQVVRFYDTGGVPNPLLDPRIEPLDLSDTEIDDLVAFLEALTGDNIGTLVADAFAAPVGDVGRAQDR